MEIRELGEWPGYLVSDDGHVFSEIKHGRFARKGRREMTLRHDQDGYLKVRFCRKGKLRDRLVHQLVLEAFVGPRPLGYVTRHLNGIRDDNRLENLRWGTVKENGADLAKHGTMKGQKHPSSKLTDSQVVAIRERYANGGISQTRLASDYGINQTLVGFIVRGEHWAHVGGPTTPSRRKRRPRK